MTTIWTPGGEHHVGGADDKLTYDALSALSRGRSGPADDRSERAKMRSDRRISARAARAARTSSLDPKTADGMWTGQGFTSGQMGGANIGFATGRPKDPMFYWEANNLPYDIRKPGELLKIRAYCNTPDAPVWMGDYSFKPMGEVEPGDEVIGWEHVARGGTALRTKLVRTTVLAVQRRIAPEVIEVTMESGRTIKCTPDHDWANPFYSPGAKPLQGGGPARQWVNAKVGAVLRHVIDPTPELETDEQRNTAHWLGGMYDGEGCGDVIAQSPTANPEIHQAIIQRLKSLGLPAKAMKTGNGIKLEGAGRGKKQALVNFVNWCNPIKRRSYWLDQEILSGRFGERDRVVEVRSLGAGEVVSMQTETDNYVAWGYASRNCRLLYMTHPIVASCIDVYSKYPLTGMELVCKDEALVEFYTTLFFDQLNYEEYLIDVGREYWTVGEAWPLGQFNEMLGVWEDDELLNPDDIEVIKTPFQKEPRFEMRLPETLRDILQKREPQWEYQALVRNYPELLHFLAPNAKMPVSNVLLKQLRFKADTFHPRGIPILMRAFRAIMQEEMLNAAQDAIADRLYTPLILARLGASATDLGTDRPWIPTDEDIADFEEALDAALAADFRVITHHFALQMDSVFGRESMPNFDNDFDRLEDRILQTFGLSRTMLNGASGGETYAADALNRDLVSQLLTTYQRMVKKLYKDRALVVAEAQEHYDYEERGGTKYPIMEEVLERDEETGEERIVQKPKLLVPDLNIKVMSFDDEQATRQFYEALRMSGVPISMKTRLTNVPIQLDDEIEVSKEEAVKLAVAAQETRKETFLKLRQEGLPIPPDLDADFTPMASDAPSMQQPELPLPSIGMETPNDQALAPTADDYAAAQAQGMDPNAGAAADAAAMGAPPGAPPVTALPRNRARPPESDEQRAGMPRASSLLTHEEHEVTSGRLQEGPSHIGYRRKVDPEMPLEEQLV